MTVVRCLLFFACICTARAGLISKADWETNAETLISVYKDKGANGWMEYTLAYTDGLLKQAGNARKNEDRDAQITFLMVAYFNLKLVRQVLVANKEGMEEFDKVELGCRQLTESVRGGLLTLGFRSTDSLYAYYYREYRKSFGNCGPLILRSP